MKFFFIDINQSCDIPLEDIYTPIDRCIIDNVAFRNINRISLIEIRQKINGLIMMMIDAKLKEIIVDNYAQRFSTYLINKKLQMSIDSDPFSIISLNWDIVMDNALFIEINKNPNKGVLDYCCHYNSYSELFDYYPGLMARGKGNV